MGGRVRRHSQQHLELQSSGPGASARFTAARAILTVVQIFRLFLLLVASMFCSGCDAKADPSPTAESGLAIATLTLRAADGSNPTHIQAEIAYTGAQRQKGLMFRETMSETRGMLFLFPSDGRGGFWMKDTILPLTIAYIGANGRVQELRAGTPHDDQTILTPAEPYRYVLEVNEGWFERHNLGVGSIITLPPGLPSAQ